MSVYNQPKLAQDALWQSALRSVTINGSSTGTTYDPPARAISLATEGTLVVVSDAGGQENIIPSGALAAGIMHPLTVRELKTEGTARGIVLYW